MMYERKFAVCKQRATGWPSAILCQVNYSLTNKHRAAQGMAMGKKNKNERPTRGLQFSIRSLEAEQQVRAIANNSNTHEELKKLWPFFPRRR